MREKSENQQLVWRIQQAAQCLCIRLLLLLLSLAWVNGARADTFVSNNGSASLVITANQSNVNLRTYAIAAGWNTTDVLTVTINAGVFIFSTSTGTPALTINGTFPLGSRLVNNGTVVGRGGNGGNGGDAGGNNGSAGGSGGPALNISVPFIIQNANIIAGGGGGGGGTGGNVGAGGCPTANGAGGGGGAGGSLGGSAGGGGGGATNGSPGTLTSAGAGGVRGFGVDVAASGGAYGQAGGGGGVGCNSYTSGGAAGAAGAAITATGNTSIIWVATGQVSGTVPTNTVRTTTLSAINAASGGFPSASLVGGTVSGKYRCTNTGSDFATGVNCTSSATGATLGAKVCDVYDTNGALIQANVTLPYATGLAPNQYIECSTSYTQPATSVTLTITSTSAQATTSTQNISVIPVTSYPSVSNGLVQWFDASNTSSVTKDGSNKVSQWADLSGGGFNATQGTAGSQPTLITDATNSKNMVRFSDTTTGSTTGVWMPTSYRHPKTTAFTVMGVLKEYQTRNGWNCMVSTNINLSSYVGFNGTGDTDRSNLKQLCISDTGVWNVDTTGVSSPISSSIGRRDVAGMSWVPGTSTTIYLNGGGSK